MNIILWIMNIIGLSNCSDCDSIFVTSTCKDADKLPVIDRICYSCYVDYIKEDYEHDVGEPVDIT